MSTAPEPWAWAREEQYQYFEWPSDYTHDDDERKSYSIEAISPKTSSISGVSVFLDFCSFCKDSDVVLKNIEQSNHQCRVCRFIIQVKNECRPPLAGDKDLKLHWNTQWAMAEFDRGGPENPFSWFPRVLEIRLGFASQLRTPSGVVGGSPTSITLAANWLRQCCGPDATPEHSRCPKIGSHSFTLPTRLLEVSGHDRDLDVRLVETKAIVNPNQPHTLLYTTLSHCWGPEGSPRLKTTPENLQARKLGIPWDSIPRTFQDAILFTHRLGVKFIWIDSCCIIQDETDLADWRREAMNMSDIYSGSYFTIMATNAANAGSGLFQTVPSHLKSRPTMPVRLPQDYHGDQVVLYAQHSRDLRSQLGRRDRYPLMTRAWCFQERCLSSRVVSFTGSEIIWRCHSVEEAELSHLHHRLYAGNDRFSIITQWHKLVKEYSSLELTHEKDRLPAIGGIAKRMSINRHGGYIAGIWQDATLYDLCWYQTSIGKSIDAGASPRQTRGPSWSWASAEGGVNFVWHPTYLQEGLVTLLAEVLDLSCDYVDPGKPFVSEATGGVLRLRSRLHLCPVEPWNQPDRPWSKGGYCWYVHRDTGISIVDVSTLYLVQISRGSDGRSSYEHLIVRHLGLSEDLYERVGFAVFNSKQHTSIRHNSMGHRYDTSQEAYPAFGPERVITII